MTLASVQFARRSYMGDEDGYEDDDDREMRCARFALCGERGEGALVRVGASMCTSNANDFENSR
ncbi:hypothetical protein FIBSPDRAFT_859466 [Athelia psychrophila]|uniref:Uncharacterized protein n=1 Tax=Athelia psychrophila TaxID=1759441 RepID=A0A166KZI4_9AGAM|nr:hypothetical protein FIBSPDRAFT_859466 [Fibularhizoctonia sp. CBS 109695]